MHRQIEVELKLTTHEKWPALRQISEACRLTYLTDQVEFGVLPDRELLKIWPSDQPFRVVCPNCPWVLGPSLFHLLHRWAARPPEEHSAVAEQLKPIESTELLMTRVAILMWSLGLSVVDASPGVSGSLISGGAPLLSEGGEWGPHGRVSEESPRECLALSSGVPGPTRWGLQDVPRDVGSDAGSGSPEPGTT